MQEEQTWKKWRTIPWSSHMENVNWDIGQWVKECLYNRHHRWGNIYRLWDPRKSEISVQVRWYSNYCLGDLNANVGSETYGNTLGDFGIGKRLVITYTCFREHHRRIYTWKSPGDLTRNRIDSIDIRNRVRSWIKQVKTYPGADSGSDYHGICILYDVNSKWAKGDRKRIWTSTA